ncbi:MAG TPA: biotin/lipoyl-containing protein [Candidatus Acidoferrum sp.]|jgi:methylmalonyl-CoA carboxyltransferase small subunit|nr:biotin/lipoyl-containing protein [Candidatus Acidoferrum sp.]
MKLKITVDGKTYEVEVEVAPEPPPVLPTFLTQSAPAIIPAAPTGSAPAGEEAADETKVCRSPVSGIVVKSNVRNGQTIETGDILFVLEAMKMETEITAPIAGKVASVKVNAGDSVKSGQVVLEWE